MALLVTNMELISKNFSGTSGGERSLHPVFSPDGSKIAFESDSMELTSGEEASDLPNIFVRDLSTGITIRVSENIWGASLIM